VGQATHAPDDADFNMAIQYVLWKYGIPKTAGSYTYNEDQTEAGLTSFANVFTGPHVTFGMSAFGSENVLASIIYHENVHVGQGAIFLLQHSEDEEECPAYQEELARKADSGIDGGPSHPGYLNLVQDEIDDRCP